MYLARYFFGGHIGSAVLGQGWAACVAGIGLALFVRIAMTLQLIIAEPRS